MTEADIPSNRELGQDVLNAFVSLVLGQRVTGLHPQLGILHGILTQMDFKTGMSEIQVDGFEESISPSIWVDTETIDLEYKFQTLVQEGWTPCDRWSRIHFVSPDGIELPIREAFRLKAFI
jgi:hypothetical protein